MSLKSLKNQTLRNKSTINSVNLTGGASTGPVITSIVVTDSNYNNLDDTALLPAGGYAKLIGSGFASGCSAYFNGSSVTTTFVSATEVRVVIPATSVGTYNVMLFNPSTAGAIYLNLGISSAPTFTTTAGSLGTSYETTAVSTSIAATGDAPITYALYSGSLPTGVTLASNGTLSGTSPVEASSTTYSFIVQATDAQLQDTTRSFSLTISTDVVTWSTPAADFAYTLVGNEAMANVSLLATSAAGYGVTYAANTLPTGVSLSGNTVFGTPTTEQTIYTALTATANTTGRTATRYVSWSVVLGDAFWKYNTLLIPGASTTFVDDASTNNFAVTINGDTKPNNFGPYTPGYYSNYFDGTQDGLLTPASAGNLVNTDFTWETWVNFSSLASASCIIGSGTSDRTILYYDTTNGLIYVVARSGSNQILIQQGSTSGWVVGTWYHVALVRSGNNYTIYRNGVSIATGTSTYAQSDLSQGLSVGYSNVSASELTVTGYISNARVVNGTAVYTSAFTPSTTPLTAISGTRLLTCQSNRFIDNSSNNFTLTIYGNVSVKSFQPFVPNSNYSTYGSGYFDGTGDYLTAPANTAFQFTGNYTIEFWVNFSTTSGNQDLVSNYNAGGSADWIIMMSATGFQYYPSSASSYVFSGVGSVIANTWYHVAAVRSGTTCSLYVNGVSVGTPLTFSGTLGDNSKPIYFGSRTGAGGYFTGYMTDVRVVKGTAVYTTTFTPPSAPLTAIANTSLLTLQNNQSVNNNTFLDNSTNNFLVTRNGNTTQGTFSPYGGNWSNYFDGTGDYLAAPAGTAIMGTSDFTIELWVYHTAGGAWAGYYYQGEGGPGGGINFRKNDLNQLSLSHDGVVDVFTSTATIPINQWVHIACSRSSGTVRFFINGAVVGTVSYATSFTGSAGGQTIGSITSGVFFLAGYISNFRVVKGTAVYTAAFTPPTTPLTAITGTEILTCQSNRLVDNSIKNTTITKAGDVSVQRFSPFSPSSVTPTSYSGYFDGTGDYIQVANDTSNQMGTGDWTAEAWIYITSYSAINAVFAKGGSTTDWFLATNNTSGKLYFGVGNSDYFSTTGPVVSLNTWNHVALVRSGTTLNSYLNGVLGNTQTGVTQNFASTGALNIGRGRDASSNYLSGYVSNARLVKGVAVYTGAFTVPTSPLAATQSSGTNIAAITGTSTSLLTCQSPTFIDNSTNNFTITAFGNSQPTQQNPFGFTSATTNGYTVSTIGGSGYFDGTGDYLSTPSLISASGDFTIECWFNTPTTLSGYRMLCGGGLDLIASNYLAIYTSGIEAQFGSGSATVVTAAYTFIPNTWNHLAMTRSGTTIRVYVNGVSLTTSQGTQASTFAIRYLANGYNGLIYTGYISDFRFVVGTSVYTSNFVPPAAPLTAIQNTSLLTNMTSAGIYDAAMMTTMETVGDVKLSTAVSKFGGTSMLFDGTGDYLKAPYNPAYSLPGDFTVETWIYLTSAAGTGNQTIASFGYNNSTGAGPWGFYLNGTGPYTLYFNSSPGNHASTTTVAIPINTWTHVTYCRSGSTGRFFVNGTIVGTSISDAFTYSGTTGSLFVGMMSDGSSAPLYGYLDDLRITRGYARYTSNFTPPTTAFQIK